MDKIIASSQENVILVVKMFVLYTARQLTYVECSLHILYYKRISLADR